MDTPINRASSTQASKEQSSYIDKDTALTQSRSKGFNPAEVEMKCLDLWRREQLLESPPFEPGKPCFSIQLPPPNVTGTLHMGHAFNQTIMDSLIRHARMQGKNTLWMPGTDHAGIATQLLVERFLEAQNTSRAKLGREKFLLKAWEWKEKFGNKITEQMRKMGSLVDWSREYFTMDPKMSKAVTEVFVTLYEQGLIYRGKRLVNWDPQLLTAVSDLETVSVEVETSLWHILYPFVDGPMKLSNQDGSTYLAKGLIVATTRPETLFGDCAVCIHPGDLRYSALAEKQVQVRLPLVNRNIPIIADSFVDPAFGTGCVKITGAHDFNDYECAVKHKLPLIVILTLDARMNENVPLRFQGLSCQEARSLTVKELQDNDYLKHTQSHKLMQPRGDRTGAVIEPMLTDQWFMAMNTPAPDGTFHPGKSLSEVALDIVRSGQIEFIPENWVNTYYAWLNNIDDWCLSRQLWWGHEIPAWHGEQGQIFVARNEEEAYKQAILFGYHGSLRKDPDVLDTWFSSALVPFTSLGWSEILQQSNRSEDATQLRNALDNFLPSTILVTGFDILFFWVARMIMLSMHFIGRPPFSKVYVHGLVRDADGQKMSKSKGNTLDPLDIITGINLENLIEKRTKDLINPKQAQSIVKKTIQEFPQGIPAIGSDALRFSFAATASLGRNINFDFVRAQGYKHFCNKLWNAARFVLMNCEKIKAFSIKNDIVSQKYSYADRWIISSLQRTILLVDKGFAAYRFDYIAQEIYSFIWDTYCDWYIELAKVQLQSDDPEIVKITCSTLLYVLEVTLRLTHPLMPFITEELWQEIKLFLIKHDSASILQQSYPMVDHNIINIDSEKWFVKLQALVNAGRNLRSTAQLSPAVRVPLYIFYSKDVALIQSYSNYIESLLKVSLCIFLTEVEYEQSSKNMPSAILTSFDEQGNCLRLALEITIDQEKANERTNKEIELVTKELNKIQVKLNNLEFITKAPSKVVDQEKERAKALELNLVKLQSSLKLT